MFSMRFLDSFGSRGLSCVKLPAAVAFPTDGRLLQRIAESRRALPANNVKPLWKSRKVAPSVSGERTVGAPSIIKASLTAVGRLPSRAEPRATVSPVVHIAA